MPSSSSAIIFNVSASIVNTIIGEMIFYPDDDHEDGGPAITKVNALKLFKKRPGESYQATIKYPLRFELSIAFTSMSYHSVKQLLQSKSCKSA
jgi:hypothetical protein